MTSDTQPYPISVRDLGPVGTGSNMFRCGVAHSSGAVFIGTYGPAPAIIWRYHPATDQLTKVAAPGEYQLDCMVEAPSGKVYIGTAYGGIVYELDPDTLGVRSLGAPPVESTPWIFTMTRTRDGEIYGARGVGLFHLDWRTGRMRDLGVVPGKHETPGVSSAPITRNLHERPDGLLWGDTNRWLFTFDPRSGAITPIVDVAAVDDACYGLVHSSMPSPTNDLYFAIYPRFNQKVPRHTFMVCRAATGALEPVDLPELTGLCIPLGWWRGADGRGDPRWLVSTMSPQAGRSAIAVVDLDRRRVDQWWDLEGNDLHPARAWDWSGPGAWFYTMARGGVFRLDPERRRLKRVAVNPMPVECRCLAAAPDGRLGTDTYDCGFVFTFDPQTRTGRDHGRVYFDDHRCNYGPAAFAGDGRYFLANHGEDEQVVRLWVTDLQTDRHWAVGMTAVQLVRLGDGSVCGTFGRNPPAVDFDPAAVWTPAWASRPAPAFRYVPGAAEVEALHGWGEVGPLAPLPSARDEVVCATGATLRVVRAATGEVASERALPRPVIALAADPRRPWLYAAVEGGVVIVLRVRGAELEETARVAFGPVDRGMFVLPESGRLIGVGGEGTVSVLEPGAAEAVRVQGPPPLFAGPAVHPSRDAWYYAHRTLAEYTLQGELRC